MSKFYLPSSTAASTASPSPLQSPEYYAHEPHYDYDASPAVRSDTDEDNDLPFPAPLPRSAFLAPDFSPQEYLSSLRNRHQTLEDLRSDLRSRVQELSKELFDLVNNEYEDFLSVGSTLRGGDDKIEEVRVGVLGFRREVEGIRDLIRDRGEEVKALIDEKRGIRRDIALGRQLLDIEDRLGELETRLVYGPDGQNQDSDDEDEDDQSNDGEPQVLSVLVTRLGKLAQLYLQVQQSAEYIGKHPLLDVQKPRMTKIRATLLLDLNAALKQAKTAQTAGSSISLRLLAIYRELGEGGEAVRVLRGG